MGGPEKSLLGRVPGQGEEPERVEILILLSPFEGLSSFLVMPYAEKTGFFFTRMATGRKRNPD